MNRAVARTLSITMMLPCTVPAAALDRKPPAQDLRPEPSVPETITCRPNRTCDISSSSVPSKLGTLQRRLDEKLSELPLSVEDFRGGRCAGASDDTCAVKAAVAAACTAGGIEVRLARATYAISDTLTMPSTCSNVWFHGVSAQGTILNSTALAKPIVSVSGTGNRVSSVYLAYAGKPQAGAAALAFVGAHNSLADNFAAYNVDIGVSVTDSSSATFLNNFQIYNYFSVGVFSRQTNDVFVSNFVFNTPAQRNYGTLGGLRLVNQVEAFTMMNGDILGGAYSMTTDAATNATGSRPAYNKFVNVYFDSSLYGVSLGNTVLTDFANCWFSAGRSGGGYAGVTLGSTDSISFTAGTTFFNNGMDGALVNATAKRTVFNGVHAEGNSATAASGVGHGIHIAAGTTDFIITNSTGSNALNPSGKQGYAIRLDPGASDRYTIQGNLVSGNVTGGVSDGGTGTNKLVQGNW